MYSAQLPSCAIPSSIVSAQDNIVELTDIGGSRLREPFFGQSAMASRHAGAQTSLVSFDELAQILAAEEVPPPRGLIFHTGRSGSTLLANLLGAGSGARVLKEPTILSEYTMYCGRRGWRDADRERLRTLVLATGRGLGAGNGPIVKFSSWTTVHLAWLAGLLPRVPVLFVWRPAVAVISSLVAKVPPWAQGHHPVEIAQALGLPLEDGTTLVDFYAWVWRACAESALALASAYGDRIGFLSYAQLCDDPAGTVAATLRRFSATPLDGAGATLTALVGRYSKDPAGRAAFPAGGDDGRTPLESADRERVAALAAPYERLLRLHSRLPA